MHLAFLPAMVEQPGQDDGAMKAYKGLGSGACGCAADSSIYIDCDPVH